MRKNFLPQIVLLIFVCAAFGQEQNDDSFVTILDHRWERVRIPGQKLEGQSASPQRMLTADDKYYQRTARENRPKGSPANTQQTAEALHSNGTFRNRVRRKPTI